MSLRRQLLLVAALSLILPWAGCEYVREIELALRDAQQSALLDSARLVAGTLTDAQALLSVPDSGNGREIYAEALTGIPVIDGYADEWGSGHWNLAVGDLPGTRYRASADARFVYLAVAVERTVSDAAVPGTQASLPQQLVLATGAADDFAYYRFAAAAPGPLAPLRVGPGATTGSVERRIQGNWQTGESGATLEIRLSRELAGNALGFSMRDSSGRSAGTLGPTDEPGRLISPSAELQGVVARFARRDLTVTVTDTAGWILARRRGAEPGTTGLPTNQPGAILPGIIRAVLSNTRAPARPPADHPEKLTGPHIENALAGQDGQALYSEPNDERAIIAVAAPVLQGQRATGTVELTQTTQALLTLTNAALTRLLGLTGLAVLATVVVLLGYSTWLSLRIRRLSQVAAGLLDEQGQLDTHLPGAKRADEIGALSRAFSRLLQQVADYNDYLRSLASRLSHEMRTPLAIVEGSLENLAQATSPDDRQVLIERARTGSARLAAILRSMSEATRTEQAIEAATVGMIDVGEFVADYAGAFDSTRPDVSVHSDAQGESGTISASPELLAQMLDKLVANAVDFHDPGTPIILGSACDGDAYSLWVENTGPPLPQHMKEQLTSSLVSVRASDRDDEAVHLGLGLYIARLIAEFHGGTLSLETRADGTGVIARATMQNLPGQGDSRDSPARLA